MRRSFLIIFFLSILTLPTITGAINFPKAISYLKVKFIASGEVEIVHYPNSFFKVAYVFVYIPQEDQRQKVKLISVSPSTYDLVKDEYGNTQVKLTFREAEKNKLPYRIEALVEIAATSPGGDISFIKETPLIKPTPQILEKGLEIGENSLDGLARLTIWVNSYMEYDKALENVTKSAEWIFNNKKGTCDEFSTLLISLMRAWKIPFRYVSGIAYSDRFERHAWVEFLVDNKWVSFDPTWVQANYLDATHIKLANLPDANFSERVEVEGRNIGIEWKKSTSYEIEILEAKERPPIEVSTKLLTEKIGGGYFLLEGYVAPKECLISTLSLISCRWNGRNVFDIEGERNIWLCRDKKTYWVGKLDVDLRKGYLYNCTLVLGTEFGVFANETITIDPVKRIAGLKIFPEKIITTPNTSFNILIKTILKNFYLLYLDEIEEIKEKEILTLKSPSKEGSYGIWLIGLDGSGNYSSLVVSKQKLVKILEIEVPANFTQGEYYLVNVTIRNIVDKELEGKLRVFFDENFLVEDVILSPNEVLRKSFNISFENVGKKEIRVILDVSEDRDVQFVEVYVTSRGVEVLEFIAGLFEKLIELFQSLIRFIGSLFSMSKK